MSITDLAWALFLGFSFGFLLQKSGLSRYEYIINVFRFKDMSVLKFMMTTLAVAMVGLYGLAELGVLELNKVNETYLVGNLLGGAIFGVGMALAGFCPGTCIAGAGQGSLDYLLPGLLGFFAGAVLYGATYQQVAAPIQQIANYGSVTLAALWGVNPWLLIMAFLTTSAMLFFFFEKKGL